MQGRPDTLWVPSPAPPSCRMYLPRTNLLPFQGSVPMHGHHIAIYTRDLPRLEAFYTQVLGFPVVRRWEAPGIVFVDAGGLWIELTRQDAPDDGTRPRALDQG